MAPKGKRRGGGPPSGRSRGGGASGGSQQSRQDRFGAYNPLAPFLKNDSHGLTMADEARYTGKRPRVFLGQDAKLRSKPVAFISAGFIEPLKELEFQTEHVVEAVKQQPVDMTAITKPSSTRADPQEFPPEAATTVSQRKSLSPSPAQLFVVDTTGDRSLRPETVAQLPILVNPSDHDSDSSEEVILFKGRDPTLRPSSGSKLSARSSPRPRQPNDTFQLREIDVEIKVVERTMKTQEALVVRESSDPETDGNSVNVESTPVNKPRHGEPSALNFLLDDASDEDAALIADYIANMDDDDEDEEDDGDDDQAESRPGLGSHAFHTLRDLGGTESDVVIEDSTEEESDPEKLDGGGADEEFNSADVQRQKIQLQDEHLARMLAKQQSLGLNGDDLLLYDGAESDDAPNEWQVAPKSTPRRKKKGSSRKAKIIQEKGQYPSATAMAEAFDDLDLMDWHKAALDHYNQAAQHVSKVPHVSDSELEEAMQLSFQNDRLRKAEKKKQREVLRAQGLLGKTINPDDLRVRYPIGMSKDDVISELEQFLLGGDEQLNFPPIDKHARKQLHMIASHLKLKSQSSGSGDSRYPVLYRTSRTLPYNERTFESIVNRALKRPYFTRVDVDTETAKAHRALRDNTNTRRGHNAVSYREGEVVGRHAEELGSENKGRLLLEKMGWTKGTALGTVENKGIMVPIAHVMKKSKVGLGDAPEY